MLFEDAQRLMIEDKISRTKYGISPIRNIKKKTSLYLYSDFFYKLAGFSSIVSFYFQYSKRLSGRKVYLYSGIGLLLTSGILMKNAISQRKELEEIFKSKTEEEFEDYITFYSRIVIATEKEDQYYNSLRH